METIEKVLGENLKLKRKELGLTQEALAERAGVSLFTVQAYEAGRRWPELPTLDKISAALLVSTVELFQLKSKHIDANEALEALANSMGFEVVKKN